MKYHDIRAGSDLNLNDHNDVKIKGTVGENTTININASGNLYTKGKICDGVRINLNASGNAYIKGEVSKGVIINIFGSGDVIFSQQPPQSVIDNITRYGDGEAIIRENSSRSKSTKRHSDGKTLNMGHQSIGFMMGGKVTYHGHDDDDVQIGFHQGGSVRKKHKSSSTPQKDTKNHQLLVGTMNLGKDSVISNPPNDNSYRSFIGKLNIVGEKTTNRNGRDEDSNTSYSGIHISPNAKFTNSVFTFASNNSKVTSTVTNNNAKSTITDGNSKIEIEDEIIKVTKNGLISFYVGQSAFFVDGNLWIDDVIVTEDDKRFLSSELVSTVAIKT